MEDYNYHRRSTDSSTYKTLEHMIETESDNAVRASLLVMLEFSGVLEELRTKIIQINTQVKQSEAKLEDLIESTEKIKNQIIGGWKVAALAFIFVQSIVAYFLHEHLSVSTAAIEKQAGLEQRIQRLEIRHEVPVLTPPTNSK